MTLVREQDRSTPMRPCRVLHVVGGMNRGGIETWLMHLLRSVDRTECSMDFLVEIEDEADYDNEILSLGSRIVRVGPRDPMRYQTNFLRILAEEGPYDVVHAHVNHFNGNVMRLSRRAGIPQRVSHCHTDTTIKESQSRWGRRLAIGILRRWNTKYCTVGLAASVPAAVSMFGANWQTNDKVRVLHCGLDLRPFAIEYDRASVRAELDLPADAWVVGHVGRMVEVKNHAHLLRSFAALTGESKDAFLLLVGDGPLRQHLEDLARQMGIGDRVRFVGNRSDVPRLLSTAIDVFAFPSQYEGLGMALIEAQAAGLPCVISDVVPTEADLIPELIHRVPLSQSWKDPLLDLRSHHRDRVDSLRRVIASDFSIDRGASELLSIYKQRATIPGLGLSRARQPSAPTNASPVGPIP